MWKKTRICIQEWKSCFFLPLTYQNITEKPEIMFSSRVNLYAYRALSLNVLHGLSLTCLYHLTFHRLEKNPCIHSFLKVDEDIWNSQNLSQLLLLTLFSERSGCSSFRCEDPSLYRDPEDMITVAHLYCVSLAFRLAIGGVSLAISSGLFGMLK